MDVNGVTPTLTVMVAAITAFSGLAGSFVGGFLQARSAARTAKSQTQAATQVAASQRFASWQMHKREVYASLLKAIQDHIGSAEPDTETVIRLAIVRALVVAHKELRAFLMKLEIDLSPLQDVAYRRDFVEMLMADVRQRGPET